MFEATQLQHILHESPDKWSHSITQIENFFAYYYLMDKFNQKYVYVAYQL